MPQYRKVKTLSDISMMGIVQLISVYSEMVSEKSYRMSSLSSLSDVRVQEFVDTRVEWIKSFVFSAVPWYKYEYLVEKILSWLTQAVHMSKAVVRRSNSPPESVHHVHVLVRFVNILVHPRVKNMDLSTMPKVLKDCIYRQLDKMTGLVTLGLGSGNGETLRQNSFKSLKKLVHLSSLTLKSDCQNETLSLIGQNCAQLRHLDIVGSGSVTEQGTSWLLLCKHLETLNMFQTSQSVPGYAQLMQGLTKLSNVGRCDQFGEVMEYIAKSRSHAPNFQINYLHTRDMTFHQLHLTVLFCPNIEHVNLYVDEDLGHLLSPLSKLKNLKEVQLLACNFHSDKVDRLVVDRGPNLQLLHLEHVDELDMSSLLLIAENCPNLVKLVFLNCDFVENFGTSLSTRKFPVAPFQKLESLVCVSECAPNVIEFLLMQAKFLKSVQFGSTAWFNDQTVSAVLSKGGLKFLTEIVILRSYELTMSSVYGLISACPWLKMLGELDGWEGVSTQDIAALRSKIRENNWDLDIDSTWSGH